MKDIELNIKIPVKSFLVIIGWLFVILPPVITICNLLVWVFFDIWLIENIKIYVVLLLCMMPSLIFMWVGKEDIDNNANDKNKRT